MKNHNVTLLCQSLYEHGCSISETSASFNAYLVMVWRKDWEYAAILNY